LPISTIFEAIHTVSYATSYHPVRDYLDSLKWDGVHRVHNFFPAFMGSEDSNYTRFVGKMLFCSAIARIKHPGCKYDYMIILEGDQGIGKSMSLKALGGDWFGEVSLTERDKDTIDKIQGLWIAEVAELAVFKKKEIEDLKSFLSTQVDRSRLAYAHTTKDFPRQCIFVGTVNPDEFGYLRDMTGNRRFLPILCGNIKVDAIKEFRDQLFAEACVLYEKGEVIYIDGSVDHDAVIQQNMRLSSDAWEQPILQWLNDPLSCKDKERVKTEDIWCHALNGELNRLSRLEQMRIANVMRKLEYVSKACRYNGVMERRWVMDSDLKRNIIKQEQREPEFTE
jgi:putative DNA primase/helicase